jgi:hypothetical protein
MGKSPIPEQPLTSRDKRKSQGQNKKTQSSVSKPKEKNVPMEQRKIILYIGPSRWIVTLKRLLKQIFWFVDSSKKVFTPHYPSARNEYYSKKVGTQRQQLRPLVFANHGNRYYTKEEYRTHFGEKTLPVSGKVALK